jgi:thiol-disulfide isomerase/thioredoxin
MTEPPIEPISSPPLGRRERMVLAGLAALLALVLFFARGWLQPQAPLEQLARRSLELPVALANGRPTILEFYADWCESCRAMAPAMEAVESQNRGKLNVVLLNVDNPRWGPELDRYEVNGIPQLELFNRQGKPIGRSLGLRSPAELAAITIALIDDKPLPRLAGVGKLSELEQGPQSSEPAATGPRSHG